VRDNAYGTPPCCETHSRSHEEGLPVPETLLAGTAAPPPTAEKAERRFPSFCGTSASRLPPAAQLRERPAREGPPAYSLLFGRRLLLLLFHVGALRLEKRLGLALRGCLTNAATPEAAART